MVTLYALDFGYYHNASFDSVAEAKEYAESLPHKIAICCNNTIVYVKR